MALLHWTQDQKGTYYSENVKLIHSAIKGIKMKGYDYEDLFQMATVGFLKGLETYDDEKNIKLSTYLTSCMTNEVYYETRKDRAKSRSGIVLSYEGTMVGNDGREMAGLDNINLEMTDGLHSHDTSMEESIENKELTEAVLRIMRKYLNDTEYQAMMLVAHNKTQIEIATRLNISQANVSKIVRMTRCKVILHLRRSGFF